MPSSTSIGLERASEGIKGARFVLRGKTPSLIDLFTLRPEDEEVKRLNVHHPVIVTGVEGKEVLVRPLRLPLVKEKDIQEALPFQAEPLLPYSLDQAFLAYQVVLKSAESTDLTLLSVQKQAIQAHLESWLAFGIEPEKIDSVPSALCEFGRAYFPLVKDALILHVQPQEMTCVLIKEGKLCASFTSPQGFNLLLTAQREEGLLSFPQHESEWRTLEEQEGSLLTEALKRLQKEATKIGYALVKEGKQGTIEGIAVTGEGAEWEGFSEVLVQYLQLPLLKCESTTRFSCRDLLSYAFPIGLALGSLPGKAFGVDFRQKEYTYPHRWRRLKTPLALYFVAIFLLAFSLYFFGQQSLKHEENQLRQTYIDLLAGMNKSHEDVEASFVAKHPGAHDSCQGEIPKIESIQREDFIKRLAFLDKELQATPDSFPLFPNIPRVSDLLAWLSHHPAIAFVDEKGCQQTRLQIDNLSYTMLKRPQQGKKQEKYQVKVELEFSTSTPKWAREFHDALIAPNDWVDPKGEVKWSSNRGKYKTSFFLKDKTVYSNL